MVYESDFSRRNYLNSCAQSGVYHTSSDNKLPSTSAYLSTRIRPADILSTSSSSCGSASADASGTRHAYRPRHSPSPQPQTSSWLERDPPAFESSQNGVQYCTCCKNCCQGNARRTYFNPGNASSSALNSADDMGAYLKKRAGISVSVDSNSTLQKPTYSVRNMPVRSLAELRETVAIRRNYVKERKGLFHETGSMFPPSTPDREASPSLHPAESIRSLRSTISPSPIPASTDAVSDTNNGIVDN